MIYIKRIAWFLLWGCVFFIVFTLGTVGVTLISDNFGPTGMIILTVLSVAVFAIADVRIDKYLARRNARFNEDFQKEMNEYLNEKR